MTSDRFRDFAELYRAAFAERNAEKKSVLLSAVQNTIDQWEQRADVWAEKKLPQFESANTQVA
jgi:hypothetical protein